MEMELPILVTLSVGIANGNRNMASLNEVRRSWFPGGTGPPAHIPVLTHTSICYPWQCSVLLVLRQTFIKAMEYVDENIPYW